jgi:hypothetical protein
VALLLALAILVPAGATPGGSLRLEEASGAGWTARQLDLAWQWGDGDDVAWSLAIASFELADGPAFRSLRLDCPAGRLSGDGVDCPSAQLSFATAGDEPARARLAIGYRFAGGALDVDLQELAHCGGSVAGHLETGPDGWQADLQATSLRLPCVAGAGWTDRPLPVSIGSGTLDGDLDLKGGRASLRTEVALVARELTFADADGMLAGEAVSGVLRGVLRRDGAAWRAEGELAVDAGVLYREPVLLDALRHGQRLTLDGSVTLASGETWQVTAAELAFASRSLGGFYDDVLQPYLIGTAWDDLQVTGEVRGTLSGGTGRWLVDARLAAVDLVDRGGRFGVGGLEGRVAWGSETAPTSRLGWAGGRVLRLALGTGEARFDLHGDRLALAAPLRQPLVDGALAIDHLEVTGLGGGALRVALAAELEPVSLTALSTTFGWPEMAGTVAGAIPALTYTDRVLSVDGTLRVDAFDGTLEIVEPRLERPLGPLPSLAADVVVDDLDLELLTRTFTIGRITGRLDGQVDGLLLQDWRPVRFDAVLQTPEDDRSRHRISQRAVDNLSSLGGLGGALSSSMLRFFDEFGYDRLGFRCRLRGTVCELDGVAPAPGGYYLVKGGGLPRIDVIGHVRRVDWAELVKRLQRAMAAPVPVVE